MAADAAVDPTARTLPDPLDEALRIVGLADDRKLLVRETSPANGASYYEQVVHALAQHGDPIAKLLDTTTFAKSRFAWHKRPTITMPVPSSFWWTRVRWIRRRTFIFWK